MSNHLMSRDDLTGRPEDPEVEIFVSSPRDTGNSRRQLESSHLLPSPEILFKYSATTHLRFPESNEPTRILLQNNSTFQHWSFEPQSLRRPRRKLCREFFIDTLMLLIGLPFLALAGALIQVHGKTTGKHELIVLEQCIKGAATLFPLIFSVVVGRALVKLASWKLERGATLGLLERLMGSRTVGGTLATQLRFYSLSIVAIALIFLWLLSPLGSQAVLRILSTASRPVASTSSLTYVNTRQCSYPGYATFRGSWFSGFASLFSASLLASQRLKNDNMDLWENVKIPYFSSLDSVPEDSDGWRQIPQDPSNVTIYSSLFGIPISDLPSGNTTFNIESTYFELSCQNIASNITRNGSNFYNPNLISPSGPFKSAQDITAQTPWAIGYLGPDVTSFLPPDLLSSATCLDCLPENVTSQAFFPGLLLYQDFEGAQNVTSVYCTPSQAYVESTVVCNSGSEGKTCAVTAQRLSTLPHVSIDLTPLSFEQTLTGLTTLLPLATQQLNHVDLLQNYIANPDNTTFIQSAQWPAFSDSSSDESRFLSISLQDFSSRLGQVVNAFLFGSFPNSTELLTASSPLPPHTSGPASAQTDLLSSIQNLTATLTVPANVISLQEVYICSYSWLGIFLGSALAIPLAAIAAAILGRMTKTRGYLGYVSSVVRESQYAGMPKGGAGMDGLEKSRKLAGLRVRLGDVGDEAGGFEIGTGVALSVGRLGIGEEGTTGRVDGRRLYV